MSEDRDLAVKWDVPSARRRSTAAVPAQDFAVIGIGAAAGGLEACRMLLAGLGDGRRMAAILVQPLHAGDASPMARLADHTSLSVQQAAHGQVIEPGVLYVGPPGAYLGVSGGALQLSRRPGPRGAQRPVDVLLQALAAAYGPRAGCIILCGAGPDGGLGARAVKDQGGLVIAQDPQEAQDEGMPGHAIASDAVDLVLKLAAMPAVLAEFAGPVQDAGSVQDASPTPDAWRLRDGAGQDALPGIIELLRASAAVDFKLYKPDMLRRRIERRMALPGAGDITDYLEQLRNDPQEVARLAKDLLINVTSFFRDPGVFDLLAKQIVPDLVRRALPDQPLRVWVAGCSTGEETYSLAMLFHEAIEATGRAVKLQIFASDVDADAVGQARIGFYPDSIEASVPPARLSRHFTKEEGGYRVARGLRASVVFSVQDVLADPPFSRVDLVSCRNLLIYLKREAQTRIISLFDFALAPGGILLLGSAETIGEPDGRFEVVSEAARLYRHVGRSAPGALSLALGTADGPRGPLGIVPGGGAARHGALAALCQRLVIEAYAPAVVLINRKRECLYSLGPTERYLRVPAGLPSHDLLALARPGVRTKLRAALYRAGQQKTALTVPGGRLEHAGRIQMFTITIQPVRDGGEDLLLVSFIDEAKPAPAGAPGPGPHDPSRLAALEVELETARSELQIAIGELETAGEDQRAVDEKTMSINEEYQSTNEELVTSKEELQSLNEELTALNSQLQETLKRQRTMSNDLQNVLYSTDVATLFLDRDLHIRFFTPATRALFSVIPGDIGRPLTDISSLAADAALADDARAVLRTQQQIARDVEAQSGVWFSRRILPYRTLDNNVEGVVITFTDITERKDAAKWAEAARQTMEGAALVTAHRIDGVGLDLRQSLQSLVLLQDLLANGAATETAKMLLARATLTVSGMASLVTRIMVSDQGDGGLPSPEVADLPIGRLLSAIRLELGDYAQAKGLTLRIVPCSLWVRADPRLLETLLRSLVACTLKFIAGARVLVGCRRRGSQLNLEVWAAPASLPASTLESMLAALEPAREPAGARGLRQGLALTGRLGEVLGHPVRVRAAALQTCVFTIGLPLAPRLPPPSRGVPGRPGGMASPARRQTGSVLVVAQDPDIRDLLGLALAAHGHSTAAALDGAAALAMIADGARPDLVLTDLDELDEAAGLERAAGLRERLHPATPMILLADERAAAALRTMAPEGLFGLVKPAGAADLDALIQRLLANARPRRRGRPPRLR